MDVFWSLAMQPFASPLSAPLGCVLAIVFVGVWLYALVFDRPSTRTDRFYLRWAAVSVGFMIAGAVIVLAVTASSSADQPMQSSIGLFVLFGAMFLIPNGCAALVVVAVIGGISAVRRRGAAARRPGDAGQRERARRR